MRSLLSSCCLYIVVSLLSAHISLIDAKSPRYHVTQKVFFPIQRTSIPWGVSDMSSFLGVPPLRGGATDEESDCDEEEESDGEINTKEDTDDEGDEDEESDVEDAESEDEYDSDEYDMEMDEQVEAVLDKEFVEPYMMSPALQLYTTFGCMMLSRRVDLFTPLVVRIIRFTFIAQIVIQQLFILYVRITARRINDRTPITLSNPVSGILQSRLDQQGGSNDIVKSIASSFLTSETTVMDYDIKQAANMQGGVFFNMAFMWFMHFKMDKVQPLLIQIVSGFFQLFYNPLFQVYILGRNLERPFKTPASPAQKIVESVDSSNAEQADENSSETAAQEDDDDETLCDEEEADDDGSSDEEDEEEEDVEEDKEE